MKRFTYLLDLLETAYKQRQERGGPFKRKNLEGDWTSRQNNKICDQICILP